MMPRRGTYQFYSSGGKVNKAFEKIKEKNRKMWKRAFEN